MTNYTAEGEMLFTETDHDPIVDAVRQKLLDRSQVGIQKYGTTMKRTDLSRLDWLRLFQEELLDGAVYMERIIQDEQNV